MLSSLPEAWLGTDLPGRTCNVTYCQFPLELLPPLPETSLDGRFAWLERPTRDLDWAIGNSGPDRAFDRAGLDAFIALAATNHLRLPASFETFLDSQRRNHIRSATGCWLELPTRLVTLPGSSSYAIRFLNDQQGVLFWYLVIGPTGDEGVVVSDDLFDSPDPWLEPDEQPATYRCASSFEAFLYRFWLENEVSFRTTDGQPLTAAQQAYVDHYWN